MSALKKITVLFMFLAVALFSCKEEVEIKNSLSVSPDTDMVFNASDNKDVTLTVTTDAERWSYTAPDWVIAKQSENTLVVNVSDNSGEERTGSISFNAGTADEVKINILQRKSGEDGGDEIEEGKIAASIKDESGKSDIRCSFNEITKGITLKLKLTLAEALQSDASVSVFIDKEYLNEYNFIHNTSYVIIPDNSLNVVEWPVTISAGSNEAELSIEIDGKDWTFATQYLLPLKVKVLSGDIDFLNKDSRVNYIISKSKYKEIKQMCVMEINDANPLNVLEYKLADGSYFFDAVVLFSGNMGWDADANAVRFNARTGQAVINKNIAALLNEWETYIKPIHDAGIKVYMGIMPHHTAAGITTLSQYGCKMFAQEMAQIIKDCQMDGVFLDEEYVKDDGHPMDPAWGGDLFHPTDGSYFAFQMSKQMDLVCDWPTEVVVYQYNLPELENWKTITDHEDPSFQMSPSEYAEIQVANYGGQGEPLEGQTLKNCTGASIELNRLGSISERYAREIKEAGYGWIMYFAFNPDKTHPLYTSDALNYFKEAARGCYDIELNNPTCYYKKYGEGVYDTKKYFY